MRLRERLREEIGGGGRKETQDANVMWMAEEFGVTHSLLCV